MKSAVVIFAGAGIITIGDYHNRLGDVKTLYVITQNWIVGSKIYSNELR